MTREELEKEATECATEYTNRFWGKKESLDRTCTMDNFKDGYLAGAEPREKHIEALEKENAELKKQCDILDKSLITSTNNNIKRQKIIDELKEKLEHRNCVDCSNYGSNIKLLKAKELIKNIIRVTWGEGWSYSLDWKVKAEQFLEE